jgi:diguanylate cyclase
MLANDDDTALAATRPAPTGADADFSISVEDRSRELMFRIAGLMHRYSTPPTPEIFEIWHAYVTGFPKPIARKVHEIVTRKGTIGDYEVRQMSDELRKGRAGEMSLQEVVGCHLEHVIAGVDQDVDNQMRANGNHDGMLRSASRMLKSQVNAVELGEVVSALVRELDTMRSETTTLSSRLAESRRQVRKLRASLAQARLSELRDPLTNLANRRHFDNMLTREIAEAEKSGTGLCLVMADLDHFKELNDRFGHVVGDDILKMFAEMLTRSFKGRDLPARFGGEEFTIILTDIDVTTAAHLVERVRNDLERAAMRIVSGKIPIGTITASFGVADYRSGDTPEQLISRADERLYAAKALGRNRVVATN